MHCNLQLAYTEAMRRTAMQQSQYFEGGIHSSGSNILQSNVPRGGGNLFQETIVPL